MGHRDAGFNPPDPSDMLAHNLPKSSLREVQTHAPEEPQAAAEPAADEKSEGDGEGE